MKIANRSEPKPRPTLDRIDSQIIETLRSNCRATNQEIAERLKLSAVTVSARLRRLEESHTLRVVAVADFAAYGYNILIAVGVTVLGRDPADVARDLARLPEVFVVHLMNGPHDIEMLVGVREFPEINVFLTDHVSKISGIVKLDPGIAAEIVKFEFNVVPL
jgi:Lrp/AsnC family transcriptional regulator for asnA, asnC and gidA